MTAIAGTFDPAVPAAIVGTLVTLVGGIEAATVAQAVTALVGFFVAYQAYRGYRRNDSRPMLFLGLGICFITTVSFVVSTLVVSPLGASEELTILSWVVSNVIGLASIFYAFTGAARTTDSARRNQ